MFDRAGAAALGLALVLLAACGGSDSPSATPAATVPDRTTTSAAAATTTTAAGADEADFDAVMRQILARRDEAYEQNKPEYLDEIYLPQCKCLEGEKADIEQQIAEGVHAAGEPLRVLSVEVVNLIGADGGVVRVVYAHGANYLADDTGARVRDGKESGPTALVFSLGRVGGTWKVEWIESEGPADGFHR